MFSILLQWKEDQQKVRDTGQKVIEMLKKASAFELGIVGTLTKGTVPEEQCSVLCYDQLSRQFDDTFGGFSLAPKFPQPCNLLFMFHFYARDPNKSESKKALNMATKTLEMMAKGGIHDHIGKVI